MDASVITQGQFNDRFILRNVALDDADTLLSWRNTSEARAASTSSIEILPRQHRSFMERRIRLGDWWILTHDPINAKPVDMGVIRFDRRTFFSIHSRVHLREAFMVNIYVDKPFRGNGVASSMISMGLTRLKREGLQFIALIRIENTASQKAFEKAGFRKWMTIKGADSKDWMIYRVLNRDIRG